MIDASGKALLCDFGLSRIRHEVTRTHTTIREGGRMRFMAPELLSGHETFRTSEASDVFSLSMVFWNAWTRKLPFAEIANELGAGAVIREGKRPNKPTIAATAVEQIYASRESELSLESPQIDMFLEWGHTDMSPESSQIDMSPESEQIDMFPESEQIDMSPELEQIDLPPESERNFLPPEIEEHLWLLLVDMWAHEAGSRPTCTLVLERLETIFHSLLEHD